MDKRDSFTKFWDKEFGNYRGSAIDKTLARKVWQAAISQQEATREEVAYRYKYVATGSWNYTSNKISEELLKYLIEEYPNHVIEPLYTEAIPNKDAERYRFIRSQSAPVHVCFYAIKDKLDIRNHLINTDLDEAIDQAMGVSNENT
jgi:hypothetical protein